MANDLSEGAFTAIVTSLQAAARGSEITRTPPLR